MRTKRNQRKKQAPIIFFSQIDTKGSYNSHDDPYGHLLPGRDPKPKPREMGRALSSPFLCSIFPSAFNCTLGTVLSVYKPSNHTCS